MASSFRPPNRLQLLYKGHKILNVIFGILIGSLAVLRRYTGRADFDSSAILRIPILMCLVDFSMLVLVCVLPQSIISIYCFLPKGRCADLEAYILTGAMVLDDYVALLMINIEYIRIVMIPGMIIVFIGTLAWKLRKSQIVEVGSSKMDHDGANKMTTEKQNNKEEIFYVENTNSSDKLELFEFVSYILQLSLVTWTQYKGQQGSTPVLSDFLLFLCSALGALGTMLASPLAGVNSRAVSVEVLPVLHKTCIVVLFIAVHTLAADWLGEDMIYVCLPELITVFVWFMVWFGESTRVSSFTLYKYQIAIFNSVVGALCSLMYWNPTDKNLRVSLIMWLFWISISSAAFSQFHVWLLHGWPGSSSESKKLIPLLDVCATACYSTAVMVCVYMMVVTNPKMLHKAISSSKDPTSLYEAISSFQDEAIAAVVIIIFVLTVLTWSVRQRTGKSTEIRTAVKRIPEAELHRNPEDESKEILDQEMLDYLGIAKRSLRRRWERDDGAGVSKITRVGQRRKSSSPVGRHRSTSKGC